MAEMAFVQVHREQGAHRRVAGRIGQLLVHLVGRGLPMAPDNVHDLPLTAGKWIAVVLWHASAVFCTKAAASKGTCCIFSIMSLRHGFDTASFLAYEAPSPA